MNTFNFYHYKTLSAFQTDLSSGTFTENDLAFIKESKQLYTHGQYYDCTGLDEQQIKDLEQINVIDEVLSLTVDKMVKASGLNADLSYSPNNEIIASAKSIAEALELLANFQSTGGIPDAPSDGVTYGRKDGNWVKANYGTPDEVLDLDELIGNIIEGDAYKQSPTPEGIYEKIEDAYNKGVKYAKVNVGVQYIVPMNILLAPEQLYYTISILLTSPTDNNSYMIGNIIIALNKETTIIVFAQNALPIMAPLLSTLYAGKEGLLTEYSKPSSYSAIIPSDSINSAIGKLEAGLVEVINIPIDQQIDVNQYKNYTIEISGYYSDPSTTNNCMFTDNFFIYTDSNDINIFQLRKIIGYIPNVDADGNNATITLNYYWSDKRFHITVCDDNGHDIVTKKEITSIRAIKYK